MRFLLLKMKSGFKYCQYFFSLIEKNQNFYKISEGHRYIEPDIKPLL